MGQILARGQILGRCVKSWSFFHPPSSRTPDASSLLRIPSCRIAEDTHLEQLNETIFSLSPRRIPVERTTSTVKRDVDLDMESCQNYISDEDSGWSGVSDDSSTDSECADVEVSSIALDLDRFDTAIRGLADGLYNIDLRRLPRGTTLGKLGPLRFKPKGIKEVRCLAELCDHICPASLNLLSRHRCTRRMVISNYILIMDTGLDIVCGPRGELCACYHNGLVMSHGQRSRTLISSVAG